MTDKKMRYFHLIYSIFVGISIVLAGICLIVSCVNIYNSGEHPYSREAVADAFSHIAIPVYICLILTIVGFVLDFLYSSRTSSKPGKDYEFLLKRLYEKKDLSQCSEDTFHKITSLIYGRLRMSVIRTSLLAVASGIILIYSLNENNFDSTDVNGSVIKAMYVIIPCLIVTFAFTLYTLIYNEKSIKTEYDLMLQLPALESPVSIETDKPSDNKKAQIIRFAILAVGLVLLIYGFITGGTADVLTKAVNICTECIGLG